MRLNVARLNLAGEAAILKRNDLDCQEVRQSENQEFPLCRFVCWSFISGARTIDNVSTHLLAFGIPLVDAELRGFSCK